MRNNMKKKIKKAVVNLEIDQATFEEIWCFAGSFLLVSLGMEFLDNMGKNGDVGNVALSIVFFYAGVKMAGLTDDAYYGYKSEKKKLLQKARINRIQ